MLPLGNSDLTLPHSVYKEMIEQTIWLQSYDKIGNWAAILDAILNFG